MHFRTTAQQKLPLWWGNRQSQPPASSLDPGDTPTQTASRSSQHFFHNAPDRQTDRQTGRQAGRQIDQHLLTSGTFLHSTNDSDAANNYSK